MGVDVLLGLQWGDEGKGKIVDFLAPKYQLVARFQGGPNAGHTLEFDGIKHVLHQIPSGIFRADIQNLIGNGVVLDPVIFRKEIAALKDLRIDAVKNLFISKRTQIILPTHGLLDAAYEKSKGDQKIGSTLKGIGPAYQDKAARLGLRVGDIVSNHFNEKYTALRNRHEAILENLEYDYDLSQLEPVFFESIDFLRQFRLTEGEYLVNDALNRGEKVLAEGAQGSLLDIDFGSYPFVTSSNTMTAGACTGLGVAPRNIGSVFGVFKAYCTRVGSGPFPTELHDADGDLMRKEGNEFGSTTGRPRRCGWLDLPALRYATMLNGVTELFMMKADVLNSFATLKVCTAYRHEDGTVSDKFPFEICNADLDPVYEELPGWNQSLQDISAFDQFPAELTGYIQYIESYVGVPVNLISVGPDRSQTILRKG